MIEYKITIQESNEGHIKFLAIPTAIESPTNMEIEYRDRILAGCNNAMIDIGKIKNRESFLVKSDTVASVMSEFEQIKKRIQNPQ